MENQRLLKSTEGNWLYNEKEKIITDFVLLGIEADESDWVEITSAEKERLEALWNEEEATTEDLYSALADLGVS